MDEPLGALDKNLRYEAQVEIKNIQRRLRMTVIYVTHDQAEAMNRSRRSIPSLIIAWDSVRLILLAV